MFSRDRRGRSKSVERKDYVSNKEIIAEIKKMKVYMDEIKQKAEYVALIKEDEVEVKNVFFAEEKEAI